MEESFAKEVAASREEKTGIAKVRELIEFEQYDEAIILCNSVLTHSKLDLLHLMQKFRACVLSNRTANESTVSALRDLEKHHGVVCERDPEFVLTKISFLLKTSQLDEVEACLPAVVSVFGAASSLAKRYQAEVMVQRGHIQEAISLINEGLSDNEYDQDLFELKGDIFLNHLSGSEIALDQYKSAMQMNRRNPLLYVKISRIFFAKNFHGDAVQYVSVALEQLSDDKAPANHLTALQRECYIIRGKSLLQLKELEEAQKNFQRVLDFDEKCIDSRIGKAQSCMLRGKSDQAVAIFKKGEELHPNLPLISAWTALAYFHRKDYDNTEIFLKKYVKKNLAAVQATAAVTVTGEADINEELFAMLNWVNFFYLDESYAMTSFEKLRSSATERGLASIPGVQQVERLIVTGLAGFGSIKRNLLEYLQQLFLYSLSGLYQWYPEDLYGLLEKHEENEQFATQLAHVFAIIKDNRKTGIYNQLTRGAGNE